MKTRPILGISLFACLFFFLIQSKLLAQAQFQPGYILTEPGDTLFGLIDNQQLQLGQAACVFKASPTAERVTYSPKDIRGYRFTHGKFYVSKEFEGQPLFLEYLIKGKLNIYFLLEGKGGRYFFEKEGTPLIEIPYEEGIKHKDDKRYEYQTTQHIGLLSFYTQDAEVLRPQIESIKTPRHKNLISLAKNYHNAVCEEEVCIVYEKRVNKFKIYLEPIVEFQKYDFLNSNSASYGTNLLLWIPGSKDRFYLKTGINFGSYSNNKNFYRFPVLFQYIYPGKRWQPKIGMGLNIYLFEDTEISSVEGNIAYSYNVHTGLNVKLTNRFMLSTTLDTDFSSPPFLFMIPTKIVYYGFSVGLLIRIL